MSSDKSDVLTLFFFCSLYYQAHPNKGKSDQAACKPGSVHSLWKTDCWMAIPLGCSSPNTSRDRPGRPAWKRACAPMSAVVPTWSCSRWGLPCQDRYRSRGALLPHPFTLTPTSKPKVRHAGGRTALCGTFPRVAPAGRYPAPYFHGARTFLPRHMAESGHPAT